jgi:hypothetical protein
VREEVCGLFACGPLLSQSAAAGGKKTCDIALLSLYRMLPRKKSGACDKV